MRRTAGTLAVGALTLALPLVLTGQTCTITNPTASQLIQVPEPVQLSLTCSGAPTAYRAVWYVDYLRYAEGFNRDQHQSPVDASEAWMGTPFAVTWYSGNSWDGPHNVYAKLFDIFTDPSTGTPLATTPVVNFTVRIEGLSNISISVPTSGIGPYSRSEPASGLGPNSSIDGMNTGSSINSTWPAFYTPCGANNQTQTVTYCWQDGTHLIHEADLGPGGTLSEPYLHTASFTSSNISGNVISAANHVFQNGRPVVFTSVSGLSPVTAGCQYFWTGSNTATVSTGSSAITVTLSSACSGMTTGTPVYLQNIPYTGVQNGQGYEPCDGYYTMASVSGSTFTVATPAGCASGISLSTCGSNCSFEVDVFPYFVHYVDANDVAFSATPGGATLALTCTSCSGTISTRTNSPWYTSNLQGGTQTDFVDWAKTGAIAGVSELVTFNNTPTPSGSASSGSSTITVSSATNIGKNQTVSGTGIAAGTVVTGAPSGTSVPISPVTTGSVSGVVTFHSPSQIQIPYWEYHGYAGKASDTLCPAGILNTDNTLTPESCSYFTYMVSNSYGISGAISVSSTGAITYNNTSSWTCSASPCSYPVFPPAQGAWIQVQIHCDTCGVGGIELPWGTAYIQNHGNSSTSVTFPHFTPDNGIVNSFTPGESFFSTAVWQSDPSQQTAWSATALKHANVNTVWYGLFTNADMVGLLDPSATTCPTPSSQPVLPGIVSWLNTNNFASVFDLYPIWSSWVSDPRSLEAILKNTGYNRQSCLQSLVNYVRNVGRGLMAFNADDEISNALGGILNPNPTIGTCGAINNRFCGISVSGGVATITGSGFGNVSVWNQSQGTGSAVEITGITSNSLCNGWYLPTAVTSITITAPALPGCGNGTAITSSTDVSAQINLPFSDWAGPTPMWQNAGYLPWNLSAGVCAWTNAEPPCVLFSSDVYVTVSGSTATLHCSTTCGTGIGNYLTVGRVIRIWRGTTSNLNIIAPITNVPDASDVQFVYPGTTGGVAPTCTGTGGQCNGTTDGFAYVTIDPNFPPNPLAQFYSILGSMSNPVPNFWTILGSFFDGVSQTLTDFEGTPANSNASWVYVQQGWPSWYGTSGTVWSAMMYAYPWGAINTRPYQQRPRGALISANGVTGNDVTIPMCKGFGYNPACDRPSQNLDLRPETKIAEYEGLKMSGITATKLYYEQDDTSSAYSKDCCGWQSQNNFVGTAINPYTAPKQWKAFALFNALVHSREDTELQPETNKPYISPQFMTDAHLSSTYGNETSVLCAQEIPYGAETVSLNPIAGGSTLLYDLDGYRLRVSQVSGNPSSIAREWCPSPGFTSVYVSQPPGYSALDNMTFGPPKVNGVVTLPFGATKFLIQVGYFPDDMRDDPVTDCTAGCTIAVDHHNLNAWYRVLYANANSLPVSIGAPVEIPSQGRY